MASLELFLMIIDTLSGSKIVGDNQLWFGLGLTQTFFEDKNEFGRLIVNSCPG